jgi:DNA polymerase-3 subunit epsilon
MYIPLDSFQSSSGFETDALVQRVIEVFRGLLPSAHAIDQVLQSLSAKPAPPSPSQRPLKSIAFVDTETSGMGTCARMTEVAVVVAAYDEIGDQVVGVLEEYSWKPPEGLNGVKACSLLDRAEFVVAHNAEFDRGVLTRELPATAKCRWRCSLREIDWKRVAGVDSESLESLLGFEGLRLGQEHTALSDARDLLRLMAVQRGGKTYLARLLNRSQGASA